MATSSCVLAFILIFASCGDALQTDSWTEKTPVFLETDDAAIPEAEQKVAALTKTVSADNTKFVAAEKAEEAASAAADQAGATLKKANCEAKKIAMSKAEDVFDATTAAEAQAVTKLENAETALASAQAELAIANKDCKQAKKAIEQAERDITETKNYIQNNVANCQKDTGGTCRVYNCYDFRKSNCVSASCVCGANDCAVPDPDHGGKRKCVPNTAKKNAEDKIADLERQVVFAKVKAKKICGTGTCTDTPGFDNGNTPAFGCAQYATKGWCANGAAVPGQEWTLGSKYKYPEKNCCVCGKPAEPAAMAVELVEELATPAEAKQKVKTCSDAVASSKAAAKTASEKVKQADKTFETAKKTYKSTECGKLKEKVDEAEQKASDAVAARKNAKAVLTLSKAALDAAKVELAVLKKDCNAAKTAAQSATSELKNAVADYDSMRCPKGRDTGGTCSNINCYEMRKGAKCVKPKCMCLDPMQCASDRNYDTGHCVPFHDKIEAKKRILILEKAVYDANKKENQACA
jgi:hypothetical protein